MNLFDWLNEITDKKRSWYSFSTEERDSFNPYMIHRFVSMKEEYVDVVDTIQKYVIGNRLIYEFYCNVLPKKRTFFKYTKSTKSLPNKELVSILAKYLEISEREVIDNFDLMGKDYIKDVLLNIGIEEKTIKKLLK